MDSSTLTIEKLFVHYNIVSAMQRNAATIASSQQNNEEDSAQVPENTSAFSTDGKLEDIKNSKPKDTETITKRPRKFLKRGEGIKQRFKIAPDAFNLSKLPPYKYANAHPSLRKQEKKVKTINSQRRNIAPLAGNTEKPIQKLPAKLDAQEQHFQKTLFESKTVANSTPEPKSLSKSGSKSSVGSKSIEDIEGNKNRSTQSTTPSTSSSGSLPLNMAWSKVLDPLNIKPIAVSGLRAQTPIEKQSQLDESVDEQLNLFELLEEKAKEGSFQFNSSIFKKALARRKTDEKKEEQDSDIIPVTAEIREAKIMPKVTMNIELDSSDSESNVENGESSDENCNSTEDEQDDNEETVATEEKEISENDNSGKTTSRSRVHFVDQSNNTAVEETCSASQVEDTLEGMNTEIFFEHAKDLLLEAMKPSQKNPPEDSLSNSVLNSEEIKKIVELSKKRLSELESEIALFKESNYELLKAKQEHELERVSFMQQQQEALEQINDEKVKMEIQFHDERMKLENERRKLDEKVRMSKNAIVTAERKEIAKLKEDINALQAKLRDKEQSHVAAQGRLRSQLRIYEKEQKDLYTEIERLKRENQKLEKMNAQLSSERNMSMLNEINRNIMKLAGNKNTTSPASEAEPISTRSNSTRSRSLTKSNNKKSDPNREAAKTIKITTSSFTHLLQNGKSQSSQDLKELEEKDLCENDSDSVTFESIPSTSPSTNTTAGKKLKTPEDVHKVLTRETTTEDGGKEIVYPNGTIRKESGDGLTICMMYFNGDVKETNVKEGTVKYYYAKTNTWHTTYLDGLQILEFPNGQVEHRLPSGVIETHFANNSIKVVDPNDKDKLVEWRFHDGSTLQEMRNGDKLLTLPNGQKELHTKEFKRREFPDGTIKTVYPDGSYETRYSNGRIRLKDKDGNLIVDSELKRNNY